MVIKGSKKDNREGQNCPCLEGLLPVLYCVPKTTHILNLVKRQYTNLLASSRLIGNVPNGRTLINLLRIIPTISSFLVFFKNVNSSSHVSLALLTWNTLKTVWCFSQDFTNLHIIKADVDKHRKGQQSLLTRINPVAICSYLWLDGHRVLWLSVDAGRRASKHPRKEREKGETRATCDILSRKGYLTQWPRPGKDLRCKEKHLSTCVSQKIYNQLMWL